MRPTTTALLFIPLAAFLMVASAWAQTVDELEAALEAEAEGLVELFEQERRLKESLLELQLARIRELISEGKKTEAAAAMKEYELAMAHFKLGSLARQNFPWRTAPPETTTETFGGQGYIGVLISSDVNVYNSLKLDQPARVRRLLNERLLRLLKEFAQAAEGARTYGLMVSLRIPYRDFLGHDSSMGYDTLQLYVPIREIKRFAEYEITSQDLVDAAVVIVNDNRVSVELGY